MQLKIGKTYYCAIDFGVIRAKLIEIYEDSDYVKIKRGCEQIITFKDALFTKVLDAKKGYIERTERYLSKCKGGYDVGGPEMYKRIEEYRKYISKHEAKHIDIESLDNINDALIAALNEYRVDGHWCLDVEQRDELLDEIYDRLTFAHKLLNPK